MGSNLRLCAEDQAVLAAGLHNHLYELLELLYFNQGPENSGWLSQDVVEAAARSIPGLTSAPRRGHELGRGLRADRGTQGGREAAWCELDAPTVPLSRRAELAAVGHGLAHRRCGGQGGDRGRVQVAGNRTPGSPHLLHRPPRPGAACASWSVAALLRVAASTARGGSCARRSVAPSCGWRSGSLPSRRRAVSSSPRSPTSSPASSAGSSASPLDPLLLLALPAMAHDRRVARYFLPLPVAGFAVSVWHMLVERGVISETQSCLISAPGGCSVKWIEEFGYVTIPTLAATGFALIGILLALAAAEE